MAERNRDDHDPVERDLSAWLPLLFVAVIMLMAGITAASILRSGALRPRVGDIVTFSPAQRDRDIWHVSVTGFRAEEPTRACVLNSRVITETGGSLVVEAREEKPALLYRLHWAGRRTDHGAGDCGGQADLLLSRLDLRKLATAAGGFGAAPRGSPP
jgi:hypothetical protein